MVLLIFVLLIGVAAVAGYLYGSGVEKPTALVTEKARNWTGTARGWVAFDRAKKRAEQFVAWLTGPSAADAELKAWAEGLAPKEAEVLARRAANFASDLDFKLAWLWEEQLAGDPQLKGELEEAMLAHCRAYRQAALAEEDTQVFATFLAWQKAPRGRRQRKLNQQLFARLVDDKLVSVPPEFYTASNKKRTAYVVETIRDFAEQDRAAFNAILKETILPPTQEAAPAEEAPAPKPGRRRKAESAAT